MPTAGAICKYHGPHFSSPPPAPLPVHVTGAPPPTPVISFLVLSGAATVSPAPPTHLLLAYPAWGRVAIQMPEQDDTDQAQQRQP